MAVSLRSTLTPSPAPVTIKTVAALARVSTATVSRVLSHPQIVRPAVRARVLTAARELDYAPNRLARGLRVRRRQVMGLLLPDLQNPFFTGIVQGVESVLSEKGYTLLLAHSDGQADRERNHLNVLRGEGAVGLVLIPGQSTSATYAAFPAGSLPVVAVDRAPRGLRVDLVTSTHEQGAREAVEHLLALGHRDIALINGPEAFDVARQRHAGYRTALRSARLRPLSSRVVHSDFRQAGGYAAMNRLLHLPVPPRAVLVANNLMTLGALQAIHEAGRSIPQDVALVCFDDMPWATSLRPPLTAVAQPAAELGRAAAQLLLERLGTPAQPPRRIILPTRLIIRESCGATPRRLTETPSRTP